MIRQMLPQQVKAKLDAGEPVVLLDVRQPEEYEFCHIAGSRLIPLGDLVRCAGAVELPTEGTVVVYCHHGVRSLTGAHLLMQAGVEDVVSMAGGIDAWSQLIDPTVPRY
ncbi:MAG: rhodanese-like domain-containing protein [Bacteroidales bacterium]|nr:rhodanese-like domain-containing protein [Bacteroidales bacterium]